jgi:hypothetical protein
MAPRPTKLHALVVDRVLSSVVNVGEAACL